MDTNGLYRCRVRNCTLGETIVIVQQNSVMLSEPGQHEIEIIPIVLYLNK